MHSCVIALCSTCFSESILLEFLDVTFDNMTAKQLHQVNVTLFEQVNQTIGLSAFRRITDITFTGVRYIYFYIIK